MPFNWKTFQTRALTAVVFVAVMLAGLLINQWTFFLLFSVIHFGCWWEYIKLVEQFRRTDIHLYLKLGLMISGYAIMLAFCDPFVIAGYGVKENFPLIFSLTGFILMIMGIFFTKHVSLGTFIVLALGWIYISFSWGFMMDLLDLGMGTSTAITHVQAVFFPLWIIGCMWVNDTGAYIIGSLIGKTPLSKISPKKTWEGTIGGILTCSSVMGGIGNRFDENFTLGMNYPSWILLAFIAAVAGTMGDLLESKLKRLAGVKDSGKIMPGHGGFLDRFDSLLITTIFVWICIMIFIQLN